MRRTHVILLALLVPAALVVGIILGGHPTSLPGFVRDPLVGDKQTRVVREAIDKVHNDYYRQIPESQLSDAAIGGVVSSLHDRFSRYFDAKQYAQFNELNHNAYEGVGMQVVKVPQGLRVVTVYDGSPAKRAGIRAGDVVEEVGHTRLAKLSSDRAVALIKGPPGTAVTLGVRHGGKLRHKTIERAQVTVPVVASALRTVDGHKIGIVRLATFSSGAHGQVDAALERLRRRGAQGYVFDLRGNGGGFVDEAQLIASAFIAKGPIVTTRGRDVPTRTLMAKGGTIVPGSAPVAVLVDHDTASASEIVTGALQDHKRATVVGVPTFGKGVFQEVVELSNGGALDITAGQYFTPNGRNLGGSGVHTGAGIRPDVRAKDNPHTRRDEGLDKALTVVESKLS